MCSPGQGRAAPCRSRPRSPRPAGPPSRRIRPSTRGSRRVASDTARRRRLDGCGGAAAARRGSQESTLAAALRLCNDFQAGGDTRSAIPLPRARRRALFVSLLLLPRFVGVHVRRHVPLPARCTATNTLTCRCLQIRRSAPCTGLTTGPTAGSARLSHGENCPLRWFRRRGGCFCPQAGDADHGGVGAGRHECASTTGRASAHGG